MCRSIHTLHNLAPPATDEDVRAAALQFVRKVSGSPRPSRANQAAFERAVDEVARATRDLLATLTTSAAPRDRQGPPVRDGARATRRRAAVAPNPATSPSATA
ncbi:MAG: DUF2277 domain-containing protein [Dehalococcoidia bacterium]